MTRAIVFSSILLLGSIAHAQSLGSCSGELAGSVGLAVPVKSQFASIAPSQGPFVFGAAECQCGDAAPEERMNVEIKLTTALPIATAGTAELWVGSGCDLYATRTSAAIPACEKVATIDIAQLTTAGPGTIELPLPAKALFSPNTHDCSQKSVANNVYLFAFTDPAQPFATCRLNLNEVATSPPPVTNVMAQVDASGMVTLRWTPPSVQTLSPAGFQVLCTPTGTLAQQAAFSTCENGVLHRRPLQVASTTLPASVGGDNAIACSGVLGAAADSATIGPITETTELQVVSIDAWGNASAPASVSVALPPRQQPQQPELAHGCSLGGAGSPTPWGASLLLLAMALGVRRRD